MCRPHKCHSGDCQGRPFVYLFCVWHPHAINTCCIAFSVKIVNFLSFSDHLLVIFGLVSFFKKKFVFNQLVIFHVMASKKSQKLLNYA